MTFQNTACGENGAQGDGKHRRKQPPRVMAYIGKLRKVAAAQENHGGNYKSGADGGKQVCGRNRAGGKKAYYGIIMPACPFHAVPPPDF